MILCCGEALIDMLAVPVPGGTEAYLPHPGGAALNTAVALGRLGCPAGLFTGLSEDFFGDQLRAHLRDSAVGFDTSTTSPAPTPLAFATLRGGEATYAFYDEGSALRRLDHFPKPIGLAEAFCFGGISLSHGRCAETFERMFTAVPPGALRIIDPNVRPALIRDESTFRSRLRRMQECADLVKLSLDDLNWLAPDTGPETFAAALLKKRPRLVLVTQGAEGATAYAKHGKICCPSRKLTRPVKDTIGAGDTFLAGFLAELHRMKALDPGKVAALPSSATRKALQFALRAASFSVTRAGADPPWRAELD
ncbi:MAG: carbohydrate kinase [Sulfitobacter sp.]|nr:carbohydrate kinase [Sulfitobacter sp.]